MALGTIVDGALEREEAGGVMRRFEVGPGVLGAVSVARQWLRGDWFLTGTLALAASHTKTAEGQLPGDARVGLTAVDFRAGVMAGRTFGPVSPYVLARGFGGPVFWTFDGESVLGTDVYKFQLGAGASVATSRGVAVLVDASLVGERALSLGVSLPL